MAHHCDFFFLFCKEDPSSLSTNLEALSIYSTRNITCMFTAFIAPQQYGKYEKEMHVVVSHVTLYSIYCGPAVKTFLLLPQAHQSSRPIAALKVPPIPQTQWDTNNYCTLNRMLEPHTILSYKNHF